MKTIWKFSLAITERQTIRMPAGARALSVGVQERSPVLWAIVESEAMFDPFEIIMAGTGLPLPDGAKFENHIGTVEPTDGLVLHVFKTS